MLLSLEASESQSLHEGLQLASFSGNSGKSPPTVLPRFTPTLSHFKMKAGTLLVSRKSSTQDGADPRSGARSHMPHGQNKNMKQKQYCNKFTKTKKKWPTPKKKKI